MARPKAKIDMDQLEKLCQLQPTDEEVAAFFNVSQKTIQRKKKEKAFREAMEKGKSKGNLSLRRWQYRAAENGNPTILIWLGKQALGQKDTIHQEVTGKDGTPLELVISREYIQPTADPDNAKD